MGLLTIQAGATADIVSPRELERALLDQDVRLRADVAAIKSVRYWANLGTVGPAAASFTTPGNMVASGLVWAVMQIGVELSTGSNVSVFLNSGQYVAGGNRFVGSLSTGEGFGTAAVRFGQFSKGQLMVNGGEALTVTPASGNLLSVFIQAIQVPAERVGELLI